MKKQTTIRIEEKIYNDYKAHCFRIGWSVSRQVERFMRRSLKDINRKRR